MGICNNVSLQDMLKNKTKQNNQTNNQISKKQNKTKQNKTKQKKHTQKKKQKNKKLKTNRHTKAKKERGINGDGGSFICVIVIFFRCRNSISVKKDVDIYDLYSLIGCNMGSQLQIRVLTRCAVKSRRN